MKKMASCNLHNAVLHQHYLSSVREEQNKSFATKALDVAKKAREALSNLQLPVTFRGFKKDVS